MKLLNLLDEVIKVFFVKLDEIFKRNKNFV